MVEARDPVLISFPFAAGVALAQFCPFPLFHYSLALTALLLLLMLGGRLSGRLWYALLFAALGALCGELRGDAPPVFSGGLAGRALAHTDALIRSIPFAHGSTNELLRALLTGQRDGLARETVDAFRAAGAAAGFEPYDACVVESYELAAGGFPDWTPWHGTTTQEPPYELLEPRFQASVLYNGAKWKGRRIEPFVGGVDGWAEWKKETQPQGRTTTGYYLRKGVDEDHDLSLRSQSIQPFVVLRYGEVLLNRAEACFRANDPAGANAAVRAIRARVGLPYVDLSGDALWAAIRQERKVELAFEGLWYWDLRRWGDASKTYPAGLNAYQVHGLKITPGAIAGQYEYSYVSVDDKDRSYPSRMDRFPIPSSELNNNAKVEQYAEWK